MFREEFNIELFYVTQNETFAYETIYDSDYTEFNKLLNTNQKRRVTV